MTSQASAPTVRRARFLNFSINSSSKREDVRNLGLLVLIFGCLLLVIPPMRSFPILDDWTYAQSVTDLVNGRYSPHDYVQPTALGHLIWGALFSSLFGQSFTLLTIVTLVTGCVCTATFYLLLRQVQVSAGYAFFGSMLLCANPLFIYLTYTFMTDISFVTYMLAGCLLYIRGLEDHAHDSRSQVLLLLAGSTMTALAYLTRQFGLLLLLAALVYLWWSGTWSWQGAMAISIIPLTTAGVYMLWQRTLPPRLVDLLMDKSVQLITSHPADYIVQHLQLDAWVVPALGLSLLPVIRLPRRPLLALPLLLFVMIFQVRSVLIFGSVFPQVGNIIDHTGFIMYLYDSATVWAEPVWMLLGIAGSVALSLHLAACAEHVYGWLRSGDFRSRSQKPLMLLYFLALMVCIVTFLISIFLFDRYLLPVLPLVMVPELRRLTGDNSAPLSIWRYCVALPVALFGLVAQRDYMEHSSVRWQAAENLVILGAQHNQIDAGCEWAGWYSYQMGAELIRKSNNFTYAGFPPNAVFDPVFAVADIPRTGYSKIGSLPYTSWLTGGDTREVLLLKRK